MVSKPVAAFWMLILYGASAYLFWSGIADSSLFWLGIAFLCGFLGFGAMVELFKRRSPSQLAKERGIPLSDEEAQWVDKGGGEALLEKFEYPNLIAFCEKLRKEHPEFAEFSNRDFIEYCEKWRKEKPEEFREMMKRLEERK